MRHYYYTLPEGAIACTVFSNRDCNYSLLLRAFEELTKGWMLHEVSWLGRIAAAKMVLLPKLMYLNRDPITLKSIRSSPDIFGKILKLEQPKEL